MQLFRKYSTSDYYSRYFMVRWVLHYSAINEEKYKHSQSFRLSQIIIMTKEFYNFGNSWNSFLIPTKINWRNDFAGQIVNKWIGWYWHVNNMYGTCLIQKMTSHIQQMEYTTTIVKTWLKKEYIYQVLNFIVHT